MQTVHFRFYGPVCSGPGPLAATPRLEHQPGAAGSPKTGNWSFTMPMAASCHSAVARALESLLPALRCTKHRRILPEQAASTVGLLSATQLTRLLRFRRCRCRRLRCFGGRTALFPPPFSRSPPLFPSSFRLRFHRCPSCNRLPRLYCSCFHLPCRYRPHPSYRRRRRFCRCRRRSRRRRYRRRRCSLHPATNDLGRAWSGGGGPLASAVTR